MVNSLSLSSSLSSDNCCHALSLLVTQETRRHNKTTAPNHAEREPPLPRHGTLQPRAACTSPLKLLTHHGECRGLHSAGSIYHPSVHCFPAAPQHRRPFRSLTRRASFSHAQGHKFSSVPTHPSTVPRAIMHPRPCHSLVSSHAVKISVARSSCTTTASPHHQCRSRSRK